MKKRATKRPTRDAVKILDAMVGNDPKRRRSIDREFNRLLARAKRNGGGT